jgi:ribonuclease Y
VEQHIGLAVTAALVTYGLLLWIFKGLLPAKLRRENSDRKRAYLSDAMRRAKAHSEELQKRTEVSVQNMREDLEEQLSTAKENFTLTEEELKSQEEFSEMFEQRIQKEEAEFSQQKKRIDVLVDKSKQIQTAIAESKSELVTQLERSSGSNVTNLRELIKGERIEKRILECQKVLRNVEQDLSENAKRLAMRMLARLEARYYPNFVWPKAVNHVDIPDSALLDRLKSDQTTLLKDLAELSEGVNIDIVEPTKEHIQPFVKFAGGFGMYKEAARLTLDELLKQSPQNWARSNVIYKKNVDILQQQALKLGKKAIRELRLNDVHEEIQKMVGYLNWRTSYRQNQYLHTFEVAQLAGLLADEMGIDADAAKRCGLLHDIGKTIDYRIEGSHAVISGDYADRFGETRLICDTLMSHHNDLVLETPLAYILKTADSLSGARPGARVNLEEDYQIRISAIDEIVRSFKGIAKVAIMNGGREVHVDVNHKKVNENELETLTNSIARKIEENVAFPGQIKVLVSRRFEAVSVA